MLIKTRWNWARSLQHSQKKETALQNNLRMSPHWFLCYFRNLTGAAGTPEELRVAVCAFDSLCPGLLCSRARWYTHSWITRAARTRSIRMNRWCTPTFAKTEDNPWTKIKLIRSPYQLFFLGMSEKWCSFLLSFCFFLFVFCPLESRVKTKGWQRRPKHHVHLQAVKRYHPNFGSLNRWNVILPVNNHLYGD